ncbi:MAG TPA: tetratricopeptide repeat protein [Burkholderiales bacterium]|jgi:predicted negative regulator of RcsB-dependent stress response|nr:tetratricopeptide repeat protein [Burkholderiales bacterium]
MAFDLEEQEQIAELKQFWKQYGKLIVTVAVAALLAFAAMQGWRYYKNIESQQASALFTKFAEAVRKNDVKDIRELGQQVMDKFGSTAYGPTAALLLAKTNFENGEPSAAAGELQWAIDHAKDVETAELARLRLASIRLDEKKYEEALKLLETKHSPAMETLYADLRGDVMLAQGKPAEARAAYKAAIDKSLPNSTYRSVVQIKLDALGSNK